MTAALSTSPQTIVVDYSNIGTRQYTFIRREKKANDILGPNTVAILE